MDPCAGLSVPDFSFNVRPCSDRELAISILAHYVQTGGHCEHQLSCCVVAGFPVVQMEGVNEPEGSLLSQQGGAHLVLKIPSLLLSLDKERSIVCLTEVL